MRHLVRDNGFLRVCIGDFRTVYISNFESVICSLLEYWLGGVDTAFILITASLPRMHAVDIVYKL
jgi:hypothetical protein